MWTRLRLAFKAGLPTISTAHYALRPSPVARHDDDPGRMSVVPYLALGAAALPPNMSSMQLSLPNLGYNAESYDFCVLPFHLRSTVSELHTVGSIANDGVSERALLNDAVPQQVGSIANDGVSERALQLINDAAGSMVPTKSKAEYLREYDRYRRFCVGMRLSIASQNSALAWLEHMKQVHFAPASTCWKRWSCAKSILQNTKYEISYIFYLFFWFLVSRSYRNVDCSGWFRVSAWLKKYHRETKNQKKSAPAFTSEELMRFSTEAPVSEFEREIIALELGLQGGLRAGDYENLFHYKNDKERTVLFHS